MNLEELVQLYGLDIIVVKSNSQLEPIRILMQYNDLAYLVMGEKSGHRYTERLDASGYELVLRGACK